MHLPLAGRLLSLSRRRSFQSRTLALLLALCSALALSLWSARERDAVARARLDSAAERFEWLTDAPADDNGRAAIAWGYSERLRLGLESPFRLIEAAARDPRLTHDERRTVAWALLAHVVRGESHEVEPVVLDAVVVDDSRSAADSRRGRGRQHLELIRATVRTAENPRAAELALRFAYTLAAAEHLVEESASTIVAEAAALIADGEIARREGIALMRSDDASDPIAAVTRRRERRRFYVERPVLLQPSTDLERDAVDMVPSLVDSLRALSRRVPGPVDEDGSPGRQPLASRLFAAGAQLPPVGPLAVTVKRFVPVVRARAPRINHEALARTRNAEMLVAVTHPSSGRYSERHAVGRLLLAAAVSMRSLSQAPVWFPGDSVPAAHEVAVSLGIGGISFDSDVPRAWHPYFLSSLNGGIADMRRVLPTLRLDGVKVRFTMRAPTDSALAMHDPRTRTMMLPVVSAGGTLSHELAHDLDRQSAQRSGFQGYRSDIAARSAGSAGAGRLTADSRLAASLRAVTEDVQRARRRGTDRPAEIFATRVDWFVANALAREGLSNGFLTAVQDEIITGHVVHPDRLRNSGRSRSLLAALQEMTVVSPSAADDASPTTQTLLRWSLSGPVDREVASSILAEDSHWAGSPLFGALEGCENGYPARESLVRMAADSRARGWLRLRARWMDANTRPGWARAALGNSPWAVADFERRVAALRDYVLVELATTSELPAGLGAYGAEVARSARC